MRASRAIVPFLLVTACGCLNPVALYRDAARRLSFHLERVEPALDLRFPLDRSRVGLKLRLGVDNPSDLRFPACTIGGQIFMDSGKGFRPLGRVAFSRSVALEPARRTPVDAEIWLTYDELRGVWDDLLPVVEGRREAAWRLEGEAGIEVLGVHVTVPVHSQFRSGK